MSEDSVTQETLKNVNEAVKYLHEEIKLKDSRIREMEEANENQRQTITAQAEGILNTGYIFNRICADNGEHSHWTVIRMSDGVKVWSENPKECAAMGHPVENVENQTLREENESLKTQLLELGETDG